MPPDSFKIDGALVSHRFDDPIDHAIVESISEIAPLVGKKTVAQFVASEALPAKFMQIGVDSIRRYGIGRPPGRASG